MKNWSERDSAEHSSLADVAQLGMVVPLHADQATAQHRATGRRNEEDPGRTGKTEGNVIKDGENEERSRREKCWIAADQERPLFPTSST